MAKPSTISGLVAIWRIMSGPPKGTSEDARSSASLRDGGQNSSFDSLCGDLWVGRWREDVIQDGQVKRVLGWNPLGTTKDYPTRKLALRALEDRLATVNNVSYRPRPVAKF